MVPVMLQQDTRWQAFFDDISFEDFVSKKLPEIRFYEAVHLDVKEAFKIVHKLLIHSYYEYLFIDVAVAKALQTFEMALKLRYKELNVKEWDSKKPLEQLIEWFRKGNLFERDDKAFFDHVRNTRNYLSHPEGHHFAGSMWFHWIETVVDLINDLYEDSVLRKQRRGISDGIKAEIKKFIKNGAKLTYKGKNELIYDYGEVLINNKVNPVRLHFSLFNLFNATSTKVKVPLIIAGELDSISFSSSLIVLRDAEDMELTITSDLSTDEIGAIAAFKDQIPLDGHLLMLHNTLIFQSNKVMLDTWRRIRHH